MTAADPLRAGRHTYGLEHVEVRRWSDDDGALRIGSFCSIADRCVVMLGGNHRVDWATTFPFPAFPERWPQAAAIAGHPATRGDVTIGSDVWIGSNVTILSGVTVGDGAVLAANATVARDVPPYVIVAGNPARVVRMRFSPERIEALLRLRWWEWDDARIAAHVELLCSDRVDELLGVGEIALPPGEAVRSAASMAGARKQGIARALRRLGGKGMRTIAGRYGFELVRAGAPAPRPALPDDVETIPRGRHERFETRDYDVLPKGRFDIVPKTYYSPVPDLAQLPADIFDRRSELGGVDLRLDVAIELLEQELAPYVAEFDAPVDDPGEPGRFFLGNTNYGPGDAELLYAFVRAKRPRRVVELGSGFTTLLIGDAARRNAADGAATEHIAYDPYPRAAITGEAPPPPTCFEPVPATEVPLTVFDELEAGDILFVDTTHTVKLGSDVNFVVLDVLPRLAPGVIVHFHDVFLPYEYPRNWFEELDYLWAEQYLLQAFLAFNDRFEVLMPAQALARERRDRFTAVIPSTRGGASPGALWLRRL